MCVFNCVVVCRSLFTNEQIDLWIVHRAGLLIDLSLGYVLFFDKTRPLGVLFGGMFHLMNSQMFSIGKSPSFVAVVVVVLWHT